MNWAEAGVKHSQISPASGDIANLPSNVNTRSGPAVEDNRASCAQDISLPHTYAYFTGLNMNSFLKLAEKRTVKPKCCWRLYGYFSIFS